MSEIADRYRRLADRFTTVVRDVPADGWDRQSPCDEWTARQVLHHVIESQHGFLGRFDRAPELPDGDEVARWEALRDAVQAALDDPEVAGTEYDGMFGRTSLEATVDQFMSVDLLVHSWDIARAAGLEHHEALPEDEVALVHGRIGGMGDAIRGPGVFGPEVPVPDDAPAQDRFLAFIGRQP